MTNKNLEEALSKEEPKEVSFVTRKALITLNRPAAVWHNSCVVHIESCFIEFTEAVNDLRHLEFPKQFRVIKFSNGPKLEKSIILNVGWQGIYSMVLLDDNEVI